MSRLRVNGDDEMSYQDGGIEEVSTDGDCLLEGRTIQGQLKTWCKEIFQESSRKTPEMTDAHSELAIFCDHIGAWNNFDQRVIIQWLTETDTDQQPNMRRVWGILSDLHNPESHLIGNGTTTSGWICFT